MLQIKFSKRLNYFTNHNKKCAIELFKEFEKDYYYGMISDLHRKFKIPQKTVSNWYKQYKNDHNWRPYYTVNHSLAIRLFTDEEEQSITEFIKENYLKQGLLFTDSQFRELAMQAYQEKHKDEENIKDFKVSDHFIHNFKIRNHISSRVSHPKRRSDSNEEFIIHWENDISELLNTFPRDRILNCDETSWQILPNSIKTWAETGSQNVRLTIRGNTKDTTTVLATIAADGTKCPLFLIAKGKTEQCEDSQLGDTAYHYRTHSINGWSTNLTFMEYLRFISNHYNNQPLHLLLDLHSSHRGQEIFNLAAELNITLHFIPAGQTDKYQPLDRTIFGPLKATARHLILKRLSENPEIKITKKDSVSDLIYSWEHLNNDNIVESWDIYDDPVEIQIDEIPDHQIDVDLI